MERCAYLRLAVMAIILLTTSSLAAQATPPATLRVIVTMDDRPYLGADVVIKPIGSPEGWPSGKTQIKLLTNAKGLARVALSPGTYRVTAKGGGRLPAAVRIAIKPGQAKPAEVRLVLQPILGLQRRDLHALDTQLRWNLGSPSKRYLPGGPVLA